LIAFRPCERIAEPFRSKKRAPEQSRVEAAGAKRTKSGDGPRIRTYLLPGCNRAPRVLRG